MMDVDQLYQNLQNATDCKCLLGKHLTPALFESLRGKTTRYGGTFADCIRTACENADQRIVGIKASDPDAYFAFSPIFNEIIKDYHKASEVRHPKPDYGEDRLNFSDLDPSGQFIVSTRVRVGRSLESLGFHPVLTKEDRLQIEKMSVQALESLEGELAGSYYPLKDMTEDDQKQLREDHFLFIDNNKVLSDGGVYNDWPSGRGIFYTPDKTFLVWVNEEDHLRFISMQKGGNLKEVYLRLAKAIRILERKLKFAWTPDLGYLTFCPSNLGTTLRASVHIKIPKLSAAPDFKEFCEKYNIQARGINGDGGHTERVGGVYDISNKRRLGLTEYEAIQEMRRGVEAAIRMEKQLSAGQ